VTHPPLGAFNPPLGSDGDSLVKEM
jgi:hypothetical protein